MKKTLVAASIALCLLTACGSAPQQASNGGNAQQAPASSTAQQTPAGSKAQQETSGGSYQYTGEKTVEIEDRSFVLEDTPESIQEETVVLNFYYTITAEFGKKADILADIEAHRISIENEQKQFEEGGYIAGYTIHQIETLAEEQYSRADNADGTSNPQYYPGLEKLREEFALEDYAVIHVTFTQTLSEAIAEAGPQWGNGTYQRSFLVGKAANDNACKIYDFGMM